MNISFILEREYPGIDMLDECMLMDTGKGVKIVKWNRPEPKPTLKSLRGKYAQYREQYDLQAVHIRRRSEYPTETELTVALWEAQVEGNLVPMNELQAKRLAIKEKYPKPQ